MASSLLAGTLAQMLHEQQPNLFRLHVNPFVTGTCMCLSHYFATISGAFGGQSFLANSLDEALSGAIKLARYNASIAGRPTLGMIVDLEGRLGPFASASAGEERVVFVPGLVQAAEEEVSQLAAKQQFGFVVLLAEDGALQRDKGALRRMVHRCKALVILCVNRAALVRLQHTPVVRRWPDLAPDIVVFDESFVDHDVPFGAFTAQRTLFAPWNRPGRATFHSTTFQPNTISSLHFLRWLEQADPETHSLLAPDLARAVADWKYRGELFRQLYNPSFYRAARLTGCHWAQVRAAGSFVQVDGRSIFDGVSGVACSVRGHNPPAYLEELAQLPESLPQVKEEVAVRLQQLTGLGHVIPAVSGASAIENALKLALVAQFPRRHVLALVSGFGGKTLLALTGTWNSSYKEHVGPLHEEVLYLDPFAPDAAAQLEILLEKYPVAVVQVELVQGVGWVRRVPDELLRFLQTGRQRWGYLLLVDEVQTGMYRTGPFTRSRMLDLTPDLLVIGKGISDMMFPFALLLCSDRIWSRLQELRSDLPAVMRQRYGYEYGYRTVLNVLRRAEELGLAERVARSGELVNHLLREGLVGCPAVREVRVFGLLLGIELDVTRWPRRWFRMRLFSFYLFAMLRQPRFPVLVGFCQSEPNVLKITPPLNATEDELRQMCATIIEVLHRPFHRLLAGVVRGLVESIFSGGKRKHEHAHVAAHEPGGH